MISGATSCFPNASQGVQIMYGHHLPEDVVSSSLEATANAVGPETHSNSLVYSLSVLKERVHQVQSMVSILISPHQSHHHHHPAAAADSTAIAIATMGNLIQEIIITASSMMFTCQQMSLGSTSGPSPGGATATAATVTVASDELQNRRAKLPNGAGPPQGLYSSEPLDQWYGDNFNSSCEGNGKGSDNHRSDVGYGNNCETHEGGGSEGLSAKNYDVIELDAADLLAKYTHYCQICGKGFKRDANLRMHMRAHGDEYKSSAALINPLKSSNGNKDGGDGGGTGGTKLPRKYSCPQEGCRWNRKHAKFQPLKSMICVKNHYKRSHCPKMYVCKRCNRKQFSVLSDLRTHEKHCGDLRWQCSCGTTFSRKDKLMGHVTLFVGHTPAIKSLVKMGKVQGDQMQ